MMSKNKAPHEVAHDSHIHIGHHWYERPIFVGLCFSLIVVACFFVGEHTSTKPRIASAATQSTPEVKKNIKIAAVGDANTVGTGIDEDDRPTLSYPAQLQRKLGSRYTVTNFGVNWYDLVGHYECSAMYFMKSTKNQKSPTLMWYLLCLEQMMFDRRHGINMNIKSSL